MKLLPSRTRQSIQRLSETEPQLTTAMVCGRLVLDPSYYNTVDRMNINKGQH